jgi:hypothetical protein
VDGVRAIDVSVGVAPPDEEDDELPEDEPLELLEELELPEELDPLEALPPHPINAPLSMTINTMLRA